MTQKMRLKMKNTFFGVLLLTVMVVAMVSTTVMVNIQDNPEPEHIMQLFRAPMVSATNNTVGAGTAGIVDIYILNDAHSDWTAIDEDDSNIYEETDGTFEDDEVGTPHEELTGETPYDTDFHIAVVYQFTSSMAYNDSDWQDSRVYAMINTSGLKNDVSTVMMTESDWYAGDDGTTQRITFYILDDDGGADDGNALQVAIGDTFTCDVTIWYYA